MSELSAAAVQQKSQAWEEGPESRDHVPARPVTRALIPSSGERGVGVLPGLSEQS